ncbi:bifunctional [glutamine synthetase] adenylyltransferase/[glutamine synthetase]-adenylyl-L-tyrosine phosphorylase [Rhodoluna sp. KAS3]|uniref:bifunctional [glutamine synthetase] adenylyltransferase/[glutamine synthetase]-adenylyl-L-tyrosine phosphorylase n=1 Tax=Rhodoluna sp. KAS3 TaxID=942880 RepID=UPI00222FF59F|nr:bifunctional [glutamine synthetase] adenylyltransferase/[glutamine synthetase]-adenylyl-L-tyrosine phosphorylase [Rhodoluna sp. KAS3]
MSDRGRGMGLSELARFGFADLSSTTAKLDQLVKLVGDSGRSALADLAVCADPDQALNALLFLAESNSAKVKAILKKPDSSRRLCLLLGASSALGDFLKRRPECLNYFDKAIAALPTQALATEFFRSRVAHLLVPGFNSPDVWSALRIAYRESLLQIAIYDLSMVDVKAGLPSVAASLADIAGAALEVAIEIARVELSSTADHGVFTAEEIQSTEFAVIAMGKCGARELNYISDVDVIYVAGSKSAELANERAVEIATKLATRMMRAIDATAAEPMLWQVDPNLRPEGKSGALVRTLESHLAYYERWAQSWEFQALLKARPLAGSSELGEAYVNALAPKVWSSASRENFVESVQKMRERVTDYIPASEVDAQIKLGPGGLRDVEFTVQLLQLVHGRTDPSVRHRDTISAINALATAGYVGRSEAAAFAESYRFLRLLEHRIQLSDMRRTHLMPASDTRRRALARAVNPKWTVEELLSAWDSVKLEVRALHQKIFYRPLLSAVSRLDGESLSLTDTQAEDRLHAIGFQDPKGALVHIAALTSGLSRRAAIQKQLLPVLLQWFSEGSDPDSALLSFRRLSEDLGESHWYLRMLRDSTYAAQRMTQVLANSKLATSLFERIPEAAAWFEKPEDLIPLATSEITSEFEAVIGRHDSSEKAINGVRSIRRRETLRIALGAVLGDIDITQVSNSLSGLFESYLRAVLSIAVEFKDLDLAPGSVSEHVDLGIIAMGRFGGEELGFGSDADVMFVYRVTDGADPALAQKVAERVISEIKRLSSDPLLEFELDLDLRPEGKNGPVARSLDSYAAYYARWANTWEAQALLRARPIAGSSELQSQFLTLINQYRYPTELTESAIVEIRRIKARVETERLPLGADPRRHLKLGRGSLSDVEWLVQLLQLQYGNEHPSIRTPKTLQALEACAREGLIAEHDARVLAEAWTLASRVRSASILWANKRTDVLPTDRRQLEGMARILEYPRGGAGQLQEDYLAFTRRSRAVFERIFYGFEPDAKPE